MRRTSQRRIGAASILAGLIAGAAYPFIKEGVIAFLAATLSADNQVTAGGEAQLTITYYFGALLLVVAGALVWASADEAKAAALEAVFLKDPLAAEGGKPLSPAGVLVFSTLAGILLTVNMYLTEPGTPLFNLLYKEDGLFEMVTAVVFLAAAVLMARAWWASGRGGGRSIPGWIRLTFLLNCLAFFLIGMEEISWGQRILGWGTPEFFQETNVQNETNVHNMFNAYFPLLYRVFAVFPVFTLLSGWLEVRKKWLPASRYVLPHPSLTGLGILMAFVAILWNHQELLEELMALGALLYSWRLARAFSGSGGEGEKGRRGAGERGVL